MIFGLRPQAEGQPSIKDLCKGPYLPGRERPEEPHFPQHRGIAALTHAISARWPVCLYSYEVSRPKNAGPLGMLTGLLPAQSPHSPDMHPLGDSTGVYADTR